MPKEARWSHLKANAPQPAIGTLVDDAMAAIERDNPSPEGVLPKDFGRAGLDKQRLGQIINLVSDIALGSAAGRAKDTLGRVYEYFLSRFASAEGKSGVQFYTPSHVVRVLVEMLAPYKGRVHDPCCGSGDISIYGQESNYTTWRLAKMNLAIRGIDVQIAHGDTFHNDRHPDLEAAYVLANPPFNDSDWRGETLFIDARKLGTMADRTHRELTDADIAKIAGTYHAWRGDKDAGEYADVPGFCKGATLEDIRKHGHVLTPAATSAPKPPRTTASRSRTR